MCASVWMPARWRICLHLSLSISSWFSRIIREAGTVLRAFYFQSLCAFEPRHLSIDGWGWWWWWGGVCELMACAWQKFSTLHQAFATVADMTNKEFWRKRWIKCYMMSSRQPHFLNLKSLTFNLIDSCTNEGLSVRFPCYPSIQQLCPGGSQDRERQETHRERQTDSSAEGCDFSRPRQSKVLKVLPSLNDSVHRE